MDMTVLRAISNATAAGSMFYVSAAEGKPLVQKSYIEVDSSQTDPSDSTKIAARITAAGQEALTAAGQSNEHTKPVSAYSVETGGFVAPKVKRGGGGGKGAPSKYNFDTMEVGAFFFVPNTDVKGNDAVKTVGSAVGAANQKYSEPTGETKEVTRAKRDEKNRAIKGADGKNVTETVTVDVKRLLRHYKVSRVENGKQYGSWTAPADGAVVFREA
jgi:hypothetical protein